MAVFIVFLLTTVLKQECMVCSGKRVEPWIAGKKEGTGILEYMSEKGTRLQIRASHIWFVDPYPLCSTIVVRAWKPFNEMRITWNNTPWPAGAVLAEYNTRCVYPGWYTWSSTALTNYVDSIIVNHPGGDTIPFFIEIKDRNGGVCDLIWYLQSKESGYSPRLIHRGDTFYSIGDSWIGDGPPVGPNDNFGADPYMYVCSCTLTTNSCTQIAMVEFFIKQGGVGVEERTKEGEFILRSNPNPFSSYSQISYAIPEKGKVVLRVYDVSGKLIKTLIDEVNLPGRYEVVWDGRDERGEKLSNGYYFYRLTIGKKSLITKSLLLSF